jgi:hypothetical protein
MPKISPPRRKGGDDGSKSNRGKACAVSGTVLSVNARCARGLDGGAASYLLLPLDVTPAKMVRFTERAIEYLRLPI